MDPFSVTFDQIKNNACIVCGAAFSVSRAAKMYCSTKCKQFAFYHRDEIKALKESKKGINDATVTLSLKEFEAYDSLIQKKSKLRNLKHRENSTYSVFEPADAQELEKLEKNMPEYLKQIKLPELNLEQWSFIKILYPDLKKEEFFKLIESLDRQFFWSLVYSVDQSRKEEINPIRKAFQKHLSKISEKLIRFE